MKKLESLLTRSPLPVLAGLLFLASPGYSAPVCPVTIENYPPLTSDACGVVITVNTPTSARPLTTGTLSYDGSDSTFGVVNDSALPLTSLLLNGGSAPLTSFSGSGIRNYISANGVEIPPLAPVVNGYEDYYGPDTTFRNVNESQESLEVDFTSPLQPGTSTYFSLPGDPATDVAGLTGVGGSVMPVAGVATPEPGDFSLWALGLLTCAAFKFRLARCLGR